ncbi:DUF1015 domain-containing protein [Candidatus Aerophobetes bacterium]|nr:DUF1015 domain-containing protein [Candidatus Aerophobetes bacterium]
MLVLRPFRGIMYNKNEVGDLSKVVAPPYDVIFPQAQDFYYRAHPCNIIRIILGKEEVGDGAEENKYTRAANFFRQWLGRGILKKEKAPSMYTYYQRYLINGDEVEREGFVALMRLEDFSSGKIFPHENVFSEPQEDRFNLLRACRANFSPIFALFSDPAREIDALYKRAKTLLEFEDENKIRHRLSSISDSDLINRICSCMQNKKIFIADGHHRYLTALRFKEEMRKKCDAPGGVDYVMMYFLNTNSPGVTILSVHRLIGKLTLEQARELIEGIEKFFYKRGFKKLEGEDEEDTAKRLLLEIKKIGSPALGVYTRQEGFSLLILKDNCIFSVKVRAAIVAILDDLVKNLLDKKNLIKGEEIDFTTSPSHAIKQVLKGHFQVAFFLAPTTVEKIQEVALTGGKMPPKSSYFYPKLLSGLVMRDLEDAV